MQRIRWLYPFPLQNFLSLVARRAAFSASLIDQPDILMLLLDEKKAHFVRLKDAIHMSSQDIATLLAAILGGILAILGGFIGALVTQRLARNEEKRTVVREKTEAVYDLSNQIDDWSSTQKSIVEKLKGIGNINALSSNSQGTLMPGESECSIDHVEMLIKLYIPSLMKQAEDISSSVSKMQALCETIKKNGRKVSDDNWNEAGSLDETIHAQVGQLQSSLINLVTY